MEREAKPTARFWAASCMTMSDWLVSQRTLGTAWKRAKTCSISFRKADSFAGIRMSAPSRSRMQRVSFPESGLACDITAT